MPLRQFYNDLTAMLIRFKESCVEWVMGRRSELQWAHTVFDHIIIHRLTLEQFNHRSNERTQDRS